MINNSDEKKRRTRNVVVASTMLAAVAGLSVLTLTQTTSGEATSVVAIDLQRSQNTSEYIPFNGERPV